jgi:uncharacterized protein DUF1353
MSSFTTPLQVQPLNDRDWKLLSPFKYHVGSLSSAEVISVPSGFVTDFASVPRILWAIIPPWGNYGKAAVIHDYCYSRELYSRQRSDEIFLEGMEVLKVPHWKRKLMYYMVRVYGWPAWKKHRSKNS